MPVFLYHHAIMKFKVGTRSSTLSLAQTQDALTRISAMLPFVEFEIVPFSSPGDRDQTTDLRDAPADFFSRDLDAAILSGDIDFALHSAKDLPESFAEGIDWFHLPWREDQRDCWVFPQSASGEQLLSRSPVVGISSRRRAEYLKKFFPGAIAKPIRGAIPSRIAQLDSGAYDAIITAGAALNRLGMQDRISRWIPCDELPPPETQGVLAITFRMSDPRVISLRNHFIKAVRFVGAGVGSSSLCTLGGVEDLRNADVCLYDDLMDEALLAHLPDRAMRIHVGKRCGAHSVPQSEINTLISRYARRGLRVVRLKGGDPGLFGRLSEEIEELEKYALPYVVRPGVSALAAATTGTGMLLTRRGISRGFTVMTPRVQGGGTADVSLSQRRNLPMVFFMSVRKLREIADTLIADGLPPDTPASIVYNAGGEDERILRGTLSDIEADGEETAPGLILVGENAKRAYRRDLGALGSCRVLLTGSAALTEKSVLAVEDLGGRALVRPMIELRATTAAAEQISRIGEYDWVVLTSPSAVRIFFNLVRKSKTDLRRIPKIAVCGAGCAAECEKQLFSPDLMPKDVFCAEALANCFTADMFAGKKVLRLRSGRAGGAIAEALVKARAAVTDTVLYDNIRVEQRLPADFDAVFFASASGAESFIAQFGTEVLKHKIIAILGKPTATALQAAGITDFSIAAQATAESAIHAIACARSPRRI